MSDYPRATGQPRVVTLHGVDYKVARLTPFMLAELDGWLKKEVPDPRVEARKQMEGLPESVQIHIWDKACEAAEDWPPTVYTQEGMSRLIRSREGHAQLYHVALRKHLPSFTLESARKLAEDLSLEEFNEVFAVMMPEDVDPPKGESVIPISATPPTPAS